MSDSFKESIKVWSTFFVAILLSIILITITGICALLRQIVRVLTFVFRRNVLAQFATGLDRLFCSFMEPSIFKTSSQTVNILLVVRGSLTLETLQSQIKALVIDFRNEDGKLVYARAQQFPTTWLGYDIYQWDQNFEIGKHVKYANNLTATNLNDFVPLRQNYPFEPKTSPWEVLIAQNYDEAGNTGVYFRFHHCLGDGLNMIDILNSRLSKSIATDAVIQKPNLDLKAPIVPSFFKSVYDNCISVPRRFMVESKYNYSLPAPDYNHVDLTCHVRTTNKIELGGLKQAKNRLNVSLTASLLAGISSSISAFLSEGGKAQGHKSNCITALLTVMLPGALKEKMGNNL